MTFIIMGLCKDCFKFTSIRSYLVKYMLKLIALNFTLMLNGNGHILGRGGFL